MDNVRVVIASLPCSVKAYTVKKDDFYTIVLNANLSIEQNRKSYLHEMYHIENRDFYSNNVGMIEFYAHQNIQ